MRVKGVCIEGMPGGRNLTLAMRINLEIRIHIIRADSLAYKDSITKSFFAVFWCQHTMLHTFPLTLGLLLICHSACSAPSLQCTRDIAAYIAGITLNPKLWALKSEFWHKTHK
jgi:hypothetical protein